MQMFASKVVIRAMAIAFVSIGTLAVAAAPASASANAVPCSPGGLCSNRFCTTTSSFTSGRFAFSFEGRGDDRAAWEEYYNVGGGTWVDDGWFAVSCPPA